MISRRFMSRALAPIVAAVALSGFGSLASANTITLSAPSVVGSTFTYAAHESGFGMVSTGDFFTIFDFGPTSSVSVPAGWTWFAQATGTGIGGTSQGASNSHTQYNLSDSDSAKLNYTFQYIGTDPIPVNAPTGVPGNPIELGDFVLVSTIFPFAYELSDYASRDHSLITGDLQNFNTENIVVPGEPSHTNPVPLPASALAGSGLMGLLGATQYLRRRSNVK